MQGNPPVRALATLGCCFAWQAVGAEPVIGQFELKTLESEPGAFEFQSQNAWSSGHPARQVASDATGEWVFDENAVVRQRHALELEAGLTNSLKMRVGVEFEKERFDDPETLEQADAFDDLQLTEFGAELIAILVPRDQDGAAFGVVMEFERPLDDEEPNVFIVGSILEFLTGRWFAAAIPMAVRTFGEGDNKWDFGYAAQLAYSFSERWSLAFEGYGTVERLADSGRPSSSARLFGDFDQHRAGAVLYRVARLQDDMNLNVGVGLLAGLNRHTPERTVKLSIELDF